MGCFEISQIFQYWRYLVLINFNMGCFEIDVGYTGFTIGNRLTLTWDVLKLECSLEEAIDLFD